MHGQKLRQVLLILGICGKCFPLRLAFFFASNPGAVPDLDNILLVMRRKLDLSVPENMHLAVWLVDHVMPKFTGKDVIFGKKVHHFEHISVAKAEKHCQRVDMTPQNRSLWLPNC